MTSPVQDGIIRYRKGEYRVHHAWSSRPIVFSRFIWRGRMVERKLPRFGSTAMKVVSKFQYGLAPIEPVC